MLDTGSFSFMEGHPCEQGIMLQAKATMVDVRKNSDKQMAPLRTVLHTSLQELGFQLGPVNSAIWSVQISAYITMLSTKYLPRKFVPISNVSNLSFSFPESRCTLA